MNLQRALDRMVVAAGAITFVLGAVELVRVVTGVAIIPQPGGAVLMAGWRTVAHMTVGVSLLLLGLAGPRPWVRRLTALAGALLAVACAVSLAGHVWPYPPGTFAAMLAQTRGIGGIAGLLEAGGLLLTALGRWRALANCLALAAAWIGGAILLGYLYGGPLFVMGRWPPVNLTASILAACIGCGLVAANGARAWPTCVFAGPGVHAMLLRALVPTLVLAIVLTDAATLRLFASISPALGSALNTLLTLVVAWGVIDYVSRIISGRLDRSQAALAASENRFSRVFQSVPAGMAVSRMEDGLLLDVNDEFCRLYGYSREEAVGRTSIELGMWLDPADRERFRAAAAAGGGDARDIELRLRRRGGDLLVVRTAVHVMELGGEAVLVGSFIDETEKRRAAAAVEASERRLATIFRESPVPLSVSRRDDGVLVAANPAFVDLVGAAAESQLVGRDPLELGLWDAAADAALRARLRDRERLHRVDFEITRPTGERRRVELSVSVYEMEGEPYLLTATVDVTDRHRAELERREAERRFRVLVEGARDVVFALGPERQVVMLNPAFERLTGLRAEDWIGHPVVDLLHADDGEAASRAMDELLHGASAPLPALRIRTADRYRLVEISLAAHEEDGRLVSILGIGRDVSERVALEEQLRQSQKIDAIGQLAGGMAHDFNNLLTVIIGSGQIAMSGLDPAMPEHTDVEEMVKAAQRAAELTRQLLVFSRRQALEPSEVDLNALLANIERMLRRMLASNVTVASRLAGSRALVLADPGQLEQVIVNLAVNARDAMPAGGTLTLKVEGPLAADPPAGQSAGRYVRLSVSDTGCGIPPEVRSKIFEPFFTTKEAGKGTGLGLSTVFGIVSQSGGFLRVQSEVGRGSTFEVYLPALDAAGADAASAPTGAAKPRGGSETILVAEDNLEVRALSTRVLAQYGYRVLAASGAEEAIEIARSHAGEIDLLITDLVMAGMGGHGLATVLSRLRPGVQVLFVSGYLDVETEGPRPAELNAPLLRKPFSPITLAERVREVLDASPPPSAEPAPDREPKVT